MKIFTRSVCVGLFSCLGSFLCALIHDDADEYRDGNGGQEWDHRFDFIDVGDSVQGDDGTGFGPVERVKRGEERLLPHRDSRDLASDKSVGEICGSDDFGIECAGHFPRWKFRGKVALEGQERRAFPRK
jgi:hypothetical protein